MACARRHPDYAKLVTDMLSELVYTTGKKRAEDKVNPHIVFELFHTEGLDDGLQ